MANQNPFEIFETWYKEAQEKEEHYPDAFTLSTASKDSIPSARTVLLKLHDKKSFTFFTNYESQKAQEIMENKNVHMLFYWKSSQKQIRIEGKAQRSSKITSDQYWVTRPQDSRLHAALSKQSDTLPESFDYETESKRIKALHLNGIPRPDHWGGFDIIPSYFEFWQEGDFRWHKREAFSLNKSSDWEVEKLFP